MIKIYPSFYHIFHINLNESKIFEYVQAYVHTCLEVFADLNILPIDTVVGLYKTLIVFGPSSDFNLSIQASRAVQLKFYIVLYRQLI